MPREAKVCTTRLAKNVAGTPGVPPQEYQARGKPMIEHVSESIERTARLTGLSPEQVLKQGIIRSKIPLSSRASSN